MNNKNVWTSNARPKENKGITLIALIITIIVMLILVAVSVRVAINSGIFGHAGNATNQWADAQRDEQALGDNIGDIVTEYLPEGTTKPGERVTKNKKYTSGNKTATIPGGFTVSGVESEQSIDGGLVIYLIPEGETVDWEDEEEVETAQRTYDQFVWIPVSDINDMYMCQSENGTKSCRITVENGKAKCMTHNSEQMAGRLYAPAIGENFNPNLTTQTYTANSGQREPDIVNNYDGNATYLGNINSILGTSYSSSDDLKNALQEEYNEIVKSVYENKGFYIGRYETSNITTTDGEAIRAVAGAIPSNKMNWYYMYAQQRDYAKNKGLAVGSTMIQGAAYDQVMKFVNSATYDVVAATNVGHGSSDFTTKPYQTGGRGYSANYIGPVEYNDKSKNIFDLEGNVRAFSTEVSDTAYRVDRGGTYSAVTNSASFRTISCPYFSLLDSDGSVAQLYVK